MSCLSNSSRFLRVLASRRVKVIDRRDVSPFKEGNAQARRYESGDRGLVLAKDVFIKSLRD